MKGSILVTLGLIFLAGILIALVASSSGLLAFQVTPEGDKKVDTTAKCESGTSPNVTLLTPDFYGGAAVTTQNIIRKVGAATTTDVGGMGGFTADPFDEYEILFGIDSNDDDAEPFGKKISYTVPCSESPEIESLVIDDSVATDLVITVRDPDDNNVITTADPIDIDAGDVKTMSAKWRTQFEEDFGNRFCEDEEGVGNVLVIRFNSTQYDDVFATDTSGNKLPSANVQISKLLSSSSGYTDSTFEAPVLRSNADWNFKIVADADDTINPIGGYNTSVMTDFNVSNITLYLFDVGWYIDNDVTPSAFRCGIMDEDGNEVGATASDSHPILITIDP